MTITRPALRELVLYAAVSAASLAADAALLWSLVTWFGAPAGYSAVAGYALGMVIHYLLSTAIVFRHRRLRAQPMREALAYWLCGLAGMAASALIVDAGVARGHSVAMAKFASLFASFPAVYLARRALLFRPERARS